MEDFIILDCSLLSRTSDLPPAINFQGIALPACHLPAGGPLPPLL